MKKAPVIPGLFSLADPQFGILAHPIIHNGLAGMRKTRLLLRELRHPHSVRLLDAYKIHPAR